ncbi:MAG: pabB, partial [Verrucomicrobiaceae bacterium]|nr:pabB [Verrucomicrobiaceae bacterium]
MISRQSLPYSEHSAQWFLRVRDLGHAVWLDSAWPLSRQGRYDIISAAPLQMIDATNNNVFSTTQQLIANCFSTADDINDLPFTGGAIGLFGYEIGRQLEQMPPCEKSLPNFPDALIGIYSWAIVVDHLRQLTTLVMRDETSPQLRAKILACVNSDTNITPNSFALTSAWLDEFPADKYSTAFSRLQNYIQAGDCYQVNLARRFNATYRGDAFAAYLRLREITAAPFSAFMESEEGALLSLSPERFISAIDGQLLTQPIKGTAPRNNDV